jgi:hypothetical protein
VEQCRSTYKALCDAASGKHAKPTYSDAIMLAARTYRAAKKESK